MNCLEFRRAVLSDSRRPGAGSVAIIGESARSIERVETLLLSG